MAPLKYGSVIKKAGIRYTLHGHYLMFEVVFVQAYALQAVCKLAYMPEHFVYSSFYCQSFYIK